MISPFNGDDIPTVLGTETLAGREMVLEGLDNVPICAPNQRYRRSGSTVSSIARSIIGCMINIGTASTVSSAKKLITPGRNVPADTTIEAIECLKVW
jgi:hypothetical protein